jgi:DNA-binding winged helix-turn-helix (wHTH) protein
MEIHLKVVGEELFQTLSNEVDNLNASFMKLTKQNEPVSVKVVHLSDAPKVEDVVNIPDAPSVILIDAKDLHLVAKIQAMEKKDMVFLKNPPCVPASLSPVVLILDPKTAISELREFPECVSDWVFMPVSGQELSRRILLSLKRKNILKARLQFGALTLMPESREISFNGKNMKLTRSEFALAELFLSQMGTVIPISDLVLLFKSTGKSTEGSNIRVTIFQLRLKLEMLTKSQYTLASVYRQGYCLRQKVKTSITPELRPRAEHNSPGMMLSA